MIIAKTDFVSTAVLFHPSGWLSFCVFCLPGHVASYSCGEIKNLVIRILHFFCCPLRQWNDAWYIKTKIVLRICRMTVYDSLTSRIFSKMFIVQLEKQQYCNSVFYDRWNRSLSCILYITFEYFNKDFFNYLFWYYSVRLSYKYLLWI